MKNRQSRFFIYHTINGLFYIQLIPRCLSGQAGGADDAGEIAEFGAQDFCAARGLAESDGEGAAAGALKEQVDGLDDAAAEDDALRIVEVDDAAKAIAQVVSGLGDDLDGQGVVLFDGVGQQARANDGLALLEL